MENYKVINEEITYKGRIIDIHKDTITLPNEKTTLREVVFHPGAAAILPIDKDGNIIFVRQYRHPAKSLVLEIPAGTLDKNEDTRDCAIRELEEETGMKTNKLSFIMKMYMAIGYSNEEISIYLAEDLEEGTQNLDEDEFVTIEKYSLKTSIDMILKGEIVDSKTIAAIFAYKEILSRIM